MTELKYIFLGLFVSAMTFAQVDRSKMPKPGPAPKIKMGEPSEFTLKNGLKVLVVENNKLPRVRVSLNIDNAPKTLGDKAGLETMVSAMMGKGTDKMSKDAFNERVDFLGATVSYGSESGYAATLSKYFEEVLGLFAQGAINPKFTAEDFDAEKAKILEGLKNEEISPESAASRVRRLLDYGKDHPYAEFATREGVEKNISLEDVSAFHETYFRPNNAYLVVVGDVKTKDVKKLVKKYFKGWKKSDLPKANMPKVPSINETAIQLVNMPSSTQSILNISYPVEMDKNNPDYFPLLVASKILGGNFNSRLNMNLREANGWTYGARGGVNDDKYIGRFYASAKVRNEVTDSAVVEAIKEIDKMTKEPVTDEELKVTKAKFTGDFVLSLERPSTVANFAVNVKTQKLEDDFYKTYLENISKVTKEDVLRVSKKYFNVNNANIHIVGKGSEIYPALTKLGYPINNYDQWGKNGEVPAAEASMDALPTVSSPISNIKSPMQIVENYLKSVGGTRENLAKVKTVMQSGTISADFLPQSGTAQVMYAAPNKTASVMNIMGNKVVQSFNGEKSIVQQGPAKREVPATDEQKNQKNYFPQLDYKEADLTYDGTEKVDGKELYKVLVKSNGSEKVEYFDPANSYLVKSVAKSAMGEIVTKFANYKNIGGVMLPATTFVRMPGMPGDLKMEFGEMKINEKIDSSVFGE